jgi:predicted aspartyl protease
MRIILKGTIANNSPSFCGSFRKDGILVFHKKGNVSFTVDTGFSGGIALPRKILKNLNIEFMGYDTFTLATGEEVELPMYYGTVLVNKKKIETWFIPGDSLLGMELISSIGKLLILDFESKKVQLS